MKILVLPGDGIGPEITAATLAVLDRASAKFKLALEWDRREIGLASLKTRGSTFPDDVLDAARRAPGIILGPVSHLDYPPREQGGINPSGELRVKLDLFANIRPAKSRLGVGLTGKPVDLVIFRECTEGFYADRNMFGDILSDEASELSGSLGLAGSTMAGDDACCAQAQHGSAPDIQGRDKANPTSLILSAAMLLEWFAARHKRPEFDQAAKAIEAAVDGSLQTPETRTRDLGGTLGTQAFAGAVADRIG